MGVEGEGVVAGRERHGDGKTVGAAGFGIGEAGGGEVSLTVEGGAHGENGAVVVESHPAAEGKGRLAEKTVGRGVEMVTRGEGGEGGRGGWRGGGRGGFAPATDGAEDGIGAPKGGFGAGGVVLGGFKEADEVLEVGVAGDEFGAELGSGGVERVVGGEAVAEGIMKTFQFGALGFDSVAKLEVFAGGVEPQVALAGEGFFEIGGVAHAGGSFCHTLKYSSRLSRPRER